jgi:hypothetical protein
MKHINTLSGQNAEILDVRESGTDTYHFALNGFNFLYLLM